MKKVSIIIPMFNAEKYIDETLQSALAQTWPLKEVIVVDDGSTDGCISIVEKYQDENVTLFKQKNKGACAARNLGLRNAKGDYVQFLDADDLLHPDKIKKQMEALRDLAETVVASSAWAKFNRSIAESQLIDRFVNQSYANAKQWLIDSWEGKGMGVVQGWLCHRNLLAMAGEWDETLHINQDGEYFCRVLLKASSIRFCPDALVYYRTSNANSISKGKSYEKALSLLNTYQSYRRNMLEQDSSYEARHALMKNFLNFIYEYYPRYPDLIKTADQNIIELGFEKYEVTGGKNFRRLASVIGFYPALKLRSVFSGK